MTDGQGSLRRWRRFLRSAAFASIALAGGTALASAAAELTVRIIAPQQVIQFHPELWEPAVGVGHRRRAAASVPINTGERLVTVHTDAEHFRTGARGRSEGDAEVLLIGDSFVEALQVEYEQSFAALLEVALSQSLGRPVAVRNAGVSDWSPNNYRIAAEQVLTPDRFALLVVAVFVGNDVVGRRVDAIPPREPFLRAHFRWPSALTASELVDAWLRPLNDALETRSHAFILVKARLAVLRMRLGLSAEYLAPSYFKAASSSDDWGVTADILASIDSLSRARGTPALFVLIPESFQVHRQDYLNFARGFGLDTSAIDLDQPSTRLFDELTMRGLAAIDVLAPFRHRSASARLYGRVDRHFSPEGHQLLSEIVSPVAASLMQAADGSRDATHSRQ